MIIRTLANDDQFIVTEDMAIATGQITKILKFHKMVVITIFGDEHNPIEIGGSDAEEIWKYMSTPDY